MWETSEKYTWKDSLQNLTNTAQNCQAHEKQGKSEKLYRPEKTKDIWCINAMWNPGLDPGTDKVEKSVTSN